MSIRECWDGRSKRRRGRGNVRHHWANAQRCRQRAGGCDLLINLLDVLGAHVHGTLICVHICFLCTRSTWWDDVSSPIGLHRVSHVEFNVMGLDWNCGVHHRCGWRERDRKNKEKNSQIRRSINLETQNNLDNRIKDSVRVGEWKKFSKLGPSAISICRWISSAIRSGATTLCQQGWPHGGGRECKMWRLMDGVNDVHNVALPHLRHTETPTWIARKVQCCKTWVVRLTSPTCCRGADGLRGTIGDGGGRSTGEGGGNMEIDAKKRVR